MTFIEVYQSKDFMQYCKVFKTDTKDLMNDVAIAILSLEESKRKQIEQDGYMLRYAQRTARNIFNNQKYKQLDLEEYRQYVKMQMLPENEPTKVFKQINKDLSDPKNSIPAKMLLYSIEHGSVVAFSRHMGVHYRCLQEVIKEYKDQLKAQIK